MELFHFIFQNSSPKGSFGWNKINYEILQLSAHLRYLQSGPLKLRLIVMLTNLEFRVRERQRKRESRRKVNEAQLEKGHQRSRARDEKQRRHFFVGRTT